MRKKRKPVCGILISRYYLDKDLIAIAKLTVIKTASGRHVWWTMANIAPFRSLKPALEYALSLSSKYEVDIHFGCTTGTEVSHEDYERLEARGLLAHLL